MLAHEPVRIAVWKPPALTTPFGAMAGAEL